MLFLGDLRNPAIMVQLQVLGLIGKLVTGPWMVQFYTNSLNKRNLEMNPEIMRALLNLSEIEKDPSLLLIRTQDVFNTPPPNR